MCLNNQQRRNQRKQDRRKKIAKARVGLFASSWLDDPGMDEDDDDSDSDFEPDDGDDAIRSIGDRDCSSEESEAASVVEIHPPTQPYRCSNGNCRTMIQPPSHVQPGWFKMCQPCRDRKAEKLRLRRSVSYVSSRTPRLTSMHHSLDAVKAAVVELGNDENVDYLVRHTRTGSDGELNSIRWVCHCHADPTTQAMTSPPASIASVQPTASQSISPALCSPPLDLQHIRLPGSDEMCVGSVFERVIVEDDSNRVIWRCPNCTAEHPVILTSSMPPATATPPSTASTGKLQVENLAEVKFAAQYVKQEGKHRPALHGMKIVESKCLGCERSITAKRYTVWSLPFISTLYET